MKRLWNSFFPPPLTPAEAVARQFAIGGLLGALGVVLVVVAGAAWVVWR